MEFYPYIKALHLIFVITWFAGLFYIPRLFIYQIEAHEKEPTERDILLRQLRLMTKRLWYIITWPSAILATGFAIALLIMQPIWLQQGWMHFKLMFVLLLFAYHGKSHHLFLQLQRGTIKWTSKQMRLWNEGATLILFAIIFLVIVRNQMSWVYGLAGIISLGVVLMLAIRLYRKLRK
jgi:putative membrane protein